MGEPESGGVKGSGELAAVDPGRVRSSANGRRGLGARIENTRRVLLAGLLEGLPAD